MPVFSNIQMFEFEFRWTECDTMVEESGNDSDGLDTCSVKYIRLFSITHSNVQLGSMPGFSNFQRFRFDFIQMEGI
jgi:hypothetical protein